MPNLRIRSPINGALLILTPEHQDPAFLHVLQVAGFTREDEPPPPGDPAAVPSSSKGSRKERTHGG